MRLDRAVSERSGLSRKASRAAIVAGEVRVDGLCERDPGRAIDAGARLALRGQALAPAGPRYFMLHKPPGYLCSTRDEVHPSVLTLLDEPGRERLHIAGRLDVDTTGLVLITDDGQWSHRVTAPRRGCAKTYRVHTAEPIAADTAPRFAEGVQLHGEATPTRPAQLQCVGPTEALLTIHEGRYHQVKRMFAAVGNRVVALHRLRIGAIELDPDLPVGGYRALTAAEVAGVGGG